MLNEKISIVMVNYNKEAYLKEAIDSVLAQTYNNWELIIVDDGSTDHSKEIITSYNDERIKPIFLPENEHICKATNKGLSLTTGTYVARLDSDDVWLETKLEKQLLFFSENPEYKICFTKLDIINENSQIVNNDNYLLYGLYNMRQKDRFAWLHFFFFEGNSLIQSSMMYEANLLKEIGMFHLSYVQAHDFDFFIRLAKKYEFGFVEEPLLLYRRTKEQNSASHEILNNRFFNEHMTIRKNFFINMSDETFIQAFKNDFIDPHANSKKALAIEKAFLLLKAIKQTDFNPLLGLFALDTLLEDPESEELLRKNYNFTPKSFYTENLKDQYYSPFIESKFENLKETIAAKEKEKEDLKQTIFYYQNEVLQRDYHIQYLEGSISWKITKPLRQGRQFFKNLFKKNKGKS